MADSKIEWTDATENVIVVQGADGKPHGWYCQKVSPGCQHCYSESLNQNTFYNGNRMKYRVSADGTLPPLMLRRDILSAWARKSKSKKRFVNSMTDTFGEFVPDYWIFEIFDAMAAAPSQTFQVLTKRAKRMWETVTDWLEERRLAQVPANIWLGVSVEDQQRADERIPWLLKTSATVRFLSCEPLLGPIDLWSARYQNPNGGLTGAVTTWPGGVQWVITGGESGHHARPAHPDWFRAIRDECQAAGTPYFHKQNGEWIGSYSDLPHNLAERVNVGDVPEALGMHCHGYPFAMMYRFGKKAAGRLLDGVEWNQFPSTEAAR